MDGSNGVSSGGEDTAASALPPPPPPPPPDFSSLDPRAATLPPPPPPPPPAADHADPGPDPALDLALDPLAGAPMSWYQDAPPPADFGNGYAQAPPSWSVGTAGYEQATPAPVAPASTGYVEPVPDDVPEPVYDQAAADREAYERAAAELAEYEAAVAGAAAYEPSPVDAGSSAGSYEPGAYDQAAADQAAYDKAAAELAAAYEAPAYEPPGHEPSGFVSSGYEPAGYASAGYETPLVDADDPYAPVDAADAPTAAYVVPADVLGAFQYGAAANGDALDGDDGDDGPRVPVVPSAAAAAAMPITPLAGADPGGWEADTAGTATTTVAGSVAPPPATGFGAFAGTGPVPPPTPPSEPGRNGRVLLFVGLAVMSLLIGGVAFAATRGGPKDDLATASENTTTTNKAKPTTTKAAGAPIDLGGPAGTTESTVPTESVPSTDTTAPPTDTSATTTPSVSVAPTPTFTPTPTYTTGPPPTPIYNPGPNPTDGPPPTSPPPPTNPPITPVPNQPPAIQIAATVSGNTITATMSVQSTTRTVCQLFIDDTVRAEGSCSSLSAGGLPWYSRDHPVFVRANNLVGFTDSNRVFLTVWSPPNIVVTVGKGKNGVSNQHFWLLKAQPHYGPGIPNEQVGAGVWNGQQVRIICQRRSDMWEGTDIWDYIQVDATGTRGWVSDNFTNDTPLTTFDPRLTQSCPPSAG